MSTYDPPCFGLGIKTVTWSPTSQFLAIGSYDEKVNFKPNYNFIDAYKSRLRAVREMRSGFGCSTAD